MSGKRLLAGALVIVGHILAFIAPVCAQAQVPPPPGGGSQQLQPGDIAQAKTLAKSMLAIIRGLPADEDEETGEGLLAAAIEASGASTPVALAALDLTAAEPNLPQWAVIALQNLQKKRRFGTGAVTYGGAGFPGFTFPGGSDY